MVLLAPLFRQDLILSGEPNTLLVWHVLTATAILEVGALIGNSRNPIASHSSEFCQRRERDANGRIRRSPARRAFQASRPCPETGLSTGACPGYAVDYVVPLKRGGGQARLYSKSTKSQRA